jgi:hypothetical protein
VTALTAPPHTVADGSGLNDLRHTVKKSAYPLAFFPQVADNIPMLAIAKNYYYWFYFSPEGFGVGDGV